MKNKSENRKSVLERLKLPKNRFHLSTSADPSLDPSYETSLKNSKFVGLFSAILILVVFLVGVWIFNTTTLYLLQKELLYWNFFSHILMIALSIAAIALSKRGFASAGFTLKNWRFDLGVAIICVISAAAFIPSLIVPSIADNAALSSIFSIAATLVTLLVV